MPIPDLGGKEACRFAGESSREPACDTPRRVVCFRLSHGIQGGVAKWPKATVCKTVIPRFKSGRRLHITLAVSLAIFV